MPNKRSASAAKNINTAADAPPDCKLCPRLVEYRNENREKYPAYFNGAVPSFGEISAKFLIVGLAPGVHGANQTGRPFTGDFAGDLLYATMKKFGFAKGTYKANPDDGLSLIDTVLTNAVRCVPPQNKPVASEIRTCRPFLLNQIDELKNLQAILCLGRISHESTLDALGVKRKDAPFGHAAEHWIEDKSLMLFDSYHCSRYNTNTRRLTTEMFEDVFAAIRRYVDKG